MASTIVIGFDDFKKLSKNKRIYYYIDDDSYEFHFLSDGMIIKSILLSTDLDNKERFFSDPMFYNAVELKFKIPNPERNENEVPMVMGELNEPIVLLQDEEVKNTDIRKEGIDDSLE